eukprot:scaffold7897_cov248-Pinguiococcus_pyrenoidosus.AAC.5
MAWAQKGPPQLLLAVGTPPLSADLGRAQVGDRLWDNKEICGGRDLASWAFKKGVNCGDTWAPGKQGSRRCCAASLPGGLIILCFSGRERRKRTEGADDRYVSLHS